MQQSNILTIILPTHFEQPDLRQDLVTTMQPARHNITNQHLSSLHYTTKHTDAHVHYFNSYLSGELGYASNLTDYYWPAYTQCRGDRLVTVAGVRCRLSGSVTLHGGPAGGFMRAGQAMTTCGLQSNYGSMAAQRSCYVLLWWHIVPPFLEPVTCLIHLHVSQVQTISLCTSRSPN